MLDKKWLYFLLIIVLLSTILLMCLVPPVSRDALTHHLAVPKLYVQQGGVIELPDIIPSYYPQLLDLIYCIPLMFNNDIVPKYIHFSFALLTAFLVLNYTQKKVGSIYAFFSVLFFLSMPVIVKLSVTVYVDLGLIFFSTASLLCLLKWHEQKTFFWVILAAIFCGLALSTKYNGLISLFLLTFFTPVIYLKMEKKNLSIQFKALGFAFMFFFISIFVFSPWMIKNYIWTKNPVYPLYDNLFNSNDELNNNKTTSKPTMNHFLVRKHVYKEPWWKTALIPVRIFFQGEDDNPKFFDGKLNPLLLILPIFAFVSFRAYKPGQDFFEQKVLLSFSFLYIMSVFFQQDMRIRWIGPAIPPLVILSAYGVKNIFRKILPQIKKNDKGMYIYRGCIFISTAFVFSMMSLNGIYLYKLFKYVDPLLYLSKRVTREEYIEKYRPEFAVLNFSNSNLNENTKLLGLFLGNRGYYSDHEINFNTGDLREIIKKSNTCNDILSELKLLKFTDIVLNYEKFNNWVNVNFSKQEKIIIKDFFNLSVIISFTKGGYGLYHLK
ncbi:phospholipid carrier-dependent glycosyltransferase [Desulfobacula sp.]|uniref:ArnT family glycosyltransferase n=1 Tax=Desulfobacula sp. TaxID=2593537 RepID=UPI0025BBD95E|nr:phospholipid carrier-dependent glycosyltransferase [Desulfobacula sp.]MBC2703252.1 phospholipid carrier-dependent glycosyltransferase [Desulfobacula sp.]